MSEVIDFKIQELNSMKKYPKNIFYKGDLQLLNKDKIAIVGSRHPNSYSKKITHQIASELAKRDIVIVSGAAIGIDSIAHKAAGNKNTIAVMANGLDIKYPAINAKLIESIEKEGLVLSCYDDGQKARKYTFVQRNELVVALADSLIVTHADENSGTLTSINYALNMGKKIYTIPHHLGDSLGTQKLANEGKIEVIYDLEKFLNSFGTINSKDGDLYDYLKSFPTYEDAIKKYKDKIFQMELEGEIKIENGYIKLI